MAETKSSPFVEYLDKEMNIMGILSVFCVAVSALALDRTAGAAVTSPLAAAWRHSAPLIASDVLLGFVAALFFYWERSLLAWYAGQLALAEATDAPKTVQERLIDADGWDTWISYRLGFISLYAAFLWMSLAVTREIFPAMMQIRQRWLIGAVLCLVMLSSIVTRHILTKYKYEEDPWQAFLANFAKNGARPNST